MYTGCSAIYVKPFAAMGCKEISPVGKLDLAIGLLLPSPLQREDQRLSNGPLKPFSIWSLSFSIAEGTPPPTQNHNQKTLKKLLSCFFESF